MRDGTGTSPLPVVSCELSGLRFVEILQVGVSNREASGGDRTMVQGIPPMLHLHDRPEVLLIAFCLAGDVVPPPVHDWLDSPN